MRARSVYGEIPGTSLIDWPITLEELEPYYDLAEAKMGVTGTNGLPPLPPNNNFKVMYWGAKRLGFDVSTGRHAINSVDYDGRPATIQDGFTITGDKTGSRWSTLNVEIPRALATGKLELRPQSRAVQIEHDAAGNASGVVYVDGNGVRQRQKARAVVLAGNCVESPRLLLHSASGRFPDGLANGWGHVGRHYLRHVIQTVWSVFDKPVNMHRGEIMTGLVRDFVRHDPARGFAGGYYVELNSMGLPTTAAFLEPGWWGRDFVSVIEQYSHMAGMLLSGEDMPQPGNRVTLTDELDAFGVPVANIHYDDHPNDLEAAQPWLQDHDGDPQGGRGEAHHRGAGLSGEPQSRLQPHGRARRGRRARRQWPGPRGAEPVHRRRQQLRHRRRLQPDADHRRAGDPAGRFHRRPDGQGEL